MEAGGSIGDEDAMAYIKDIPIDMDNDCYLFINIVDYVWAKFLQTSKMSKGLIDMFFCDYYLVSYKNN